MRNSRILLLVLIFAIIYSCKNEKKQETAPEIKFNLDKVPKNIKVDKPKQIDDIEDLLSAEEKKKLQSYLNLLEEENFPKFYISTITTTKSDLEWLVTTTISNNGIVFVLSKSGKYVHISLEEEIYLKYNKKVKDIIRKIIIPNFEKEKYFFGIKKGITEIVNNLKDIQ